MTMKYGFAISVSILLHLSVADAQTTPPANTSPPPQAPAATPPPTPIPFDDALLKAANDLLSKANANQSSDGKTNLLIDPLIDGVTGAQSKATQTMGSRIVDLVQSSYPKFQVKSFTSAELEKNPVVLIGTFTPINNAGTAGGAKDAYRICLAMADLGTKKIISKGAARAKLEGVDATPTSFFADAPVFSKDPPVEAYVKSCQGTKPGDAIEQTYIDRIASGALIADATNAYDNRKYQQALELYEKASKLPGEDQLRALNGVYLANWRLHRQQAMTQAFGRLVDYGLNNDRLAIKFLFRKGTTNFVTDRIISTPYAMWLENIATKSAKSKTCLDVIGHASPTGPVDLNDKLSTMRAKYVMQRMTNLVNSVASQMTASGVGSKQNIVGTGRDDASDALDRRVEFKVKSGCSEQKKVTQLHNLKTSLL